MSSEDSSSPRRSLIRTKLMSKILPKKRKEEQKVQNVKFVNETSNSLLLHEQQQQDQQVHLEHKQRQVQTDAEQVYLSYPQRWWLLLTVVLLNLANYSHWVAFPSVTKVAAKYYDQSGETMDLIPTVSYGLGVPFCIVATYVVERFGLRAGLHIGGSLTGIGGLMCFFSSLPGVSDGLSNDAKFYLALIGQALTGIACPFISCVPTKISQHWFSDRQRTVATILLGMSNPMGIVLGQGITPLLVTSPDRVPVMNVVWFIPAGLGSILTMWKVTANRPPSPPSPSAAAALQDRARGSYWPSIKALLTNKAFLILFVFVGGAMGYVSCISTKIEQIMCASGYSDQLSGLSGSLILLVGFVASFPMGLLAYKTGRLTLICKLCGVGAITSMALMAYFMRMPNMGGGIIASCVMLGVFALGCYPIALELVVECTYPVDQATGTAFIFLSSALQGVLLMQVENSFGHPLSEEEMEVQTCVEPGDGGHQQPKDYGSYLNFVTAYMSFFILVFIAFFSTEMKRTNADRVRAAAGASGGEVEAALPAAVAKKGGSRNEVQIETSSLLLMEEDGDGCTRSSVETAAATAATASSRVTSMATSMMTSSTTTSAAEDESSSSAAGSSASSLVTDSKIPA